MGAPGLSDTLRAVALRVAAFLRGRVLADERGAAMVEYIVILGAVGLTVSAAIAGIGPILLADYVRARQILISPFP